VWDQASGERAAGRVPSVANFQTLLSAAQAQAQREGPATPEQGDEPGTVRIDSGGLRRCVFAKVSLCSQLRSRSAICCIRQSDWHVWSDAAIKRVVQTGADHSLAPASEAFDKTLTPNIALSC